MKARSSTSDEKRQRRIQIGVSIFLVFILVFSYVAYYFTPDDTTQSYNGVKVSAQTTGTGSIVGYTAVVGGKTYSFYSAPKDSLDIALPAALFPQLWTAPVYVVLFDPKDNLTAVYDQVRFDYENTITSPQVAAVTAASSRYPFRVLSCDNATVGLPFLYLTSQGNGSITYLGGCYIFAGSQNDQLRMRDRILYRFLNITTS